MEKWTLFYSGLNDTGRIHSTKYDNSGEGDRYIEVIEKEAFDLMIEDVKKLVAALDEIVAIDLDTQRRFPKYQGTFSHYGDIARKALQEFKDKWGEL